MTENSAKFEWSATESAPKDYPMEIIQGTFVYHGETEQGLYVPSGGTIHYGWGTSVSSHVTGERYKPLPERLKITFFSYTENKFFKGDFKLPYERILTLFKEAGVNEHGDPNMGKIIAGIAPGGTVAVWVAGSVGYTEVFYGKAEQVDLSPSAAFKLPFKNEEDANNYIAEGLQESVSTEQLEKIKKDGVPLDLWDRYRLPYFWSPSSKSGSTLNKLNVSYHNGESRKHLNREDFISPHPVPERISFNSLVNEKQVIYQFNFDEFEIMQAFQNLGGQGEKVTVEFDLRFPRSASKVWLHNENESVQLGKVEIPDW